MKIFVLIICLLAIYFPIHSQDTSSFFQYSTINALLEGYYDGDLSCKELKEHGDFGIGTFNGLDGELILYQGVCYRSLNDGSIELVSDSVKTPFASVAYFKPSITISVSSYKAYSNLSQMIDSILKTKNTVEAIKIEGLFRNIKLRSVPRQTKPYQKLVKIVETQPTFEYQNIEGSLIGFRCPDYAMGINVPKYHFHFLSKNKQKGGHLLDMSVDKAQVTIQYLRKILVQIPDNILFDSLLLEHNQSAELEKVEK